MYTAGTGMYRRKATYLGVYREGIYTPRGYPGRHIGGVYTRVYLTQEREKGSISPPRRGRKRE